MAGAVARHGEVEDRGDDGEQVVIGGDETLHRFALLMTVPGERA